MNFSWVETFTSSNFRGDKFLRTPLAKIWFRRDKHFRAREHLAKFSDFHATLKQISRQSEYFAAYLQTISSMIFVLPKWGGFDRFPVRSNQYFASEKFAPINYNAYQLRICKSKCEWAGQQYDIWRIISFSLPE